MERRISRSARARTYVRAIMWSSVLALMLAPSASNATRAYARDQLGSVNDYLDNNTAFPGADEFPALGIAVINGQGTLQDGHEFDGAEIVDVVPDSTGARAGLKGGQQRARELITLGVVVAWLLFPPAVMAAAAFGSGRMGESHEYIIAIDGIRIHDVLEFKEALNHAQSGEIVYLTIVSGGHRKQIQLRFPGRQSSS